MNHILYLTQSLLEIPKGRRKDAKEERNRKISVWYKYMKTAVIRRKEDHKIVLIDFGGVKQIQPQQQTPDNLTIGFGTSGYAPGEQLNGMPRLNSDIYALGIIAIQALTGITPKDFRRHGNTGLIVIDHTSSRDEGTLQNWQQIANINDNDKLVRILNKMVNLDFTKRYESAKEILEDIK
jgi:serine/threonine protein kinase